MKENKITTNNAEKISSEFHVFCRKVIRRSILNQLRGYVRYCRNYGTVPLEETEESAMAVYDDILEGKVKIPVCGTVVLIGDEDAMQEVFDQYDRLINYILFCEIRSWQLNSTLMPIEDMEQQVKADLVKAIRKFTIRN